MSTADNKTKQTTDPSLVPLIRSEEARLAEELEKTRAQTQALVAEAHQKAEARIESARQKIPEMIGQTRTQEIQGLGARTHSQKEQAQQAASALETKARHNLSAAVDKIISLVIPEDPA